MNRGFLYGDGFFESIRIENGEIPLLTYHLERIYDGIEIYQFEPSFDINDEFILEIAKSYGKKGVLRINFLEMEKGNILQIMIL